jgi:hypothetical protein
MNTDTPSRHPGYLSDRRRLSPAPDSNPKYVVCCNCNAATPWTFPFPRYCTRCNHRVQKCYRSFQLAVGIRCGWHGSCCVSSRVCWVAINDGMSCNRGYRWCWSSEDAIENHYGIHRKGSQLSTRSCLSISWFFSSSFFMYHTLCTRTQFCRYFSILPKSNEQWLIMIRACTQLVPIVSYMNWQNISAGLTFNFPDGKIVKPLGHRIDKIREILIHDGWTLSAINSPPLYINQHAY